MKISNCPETIFLNIGEGVYEGDDFEELLKGEVTWSKDKVFPFDVEYTLAQRNNHKPNLRDISRSKIFEGLAISCIETISSEMLDTEKVELINNKVAAIIRLAALPVDHFSQDQVEEALNNRA